MFRALRRPIAAAATLAAAGAALVSCDAAQPKGLNEQRKASVVARPGTRTDVSPLTLEYFALRGLGEVPRLILEVTGLPYSCVFHYLDGEWRSRAAFGQLPILHDGDLTICQSRTIARYLARKACIDGASEADKVNVDMWCEFHRDLNDKRKAAHDLAGHADGPKLKKMLDMAEGALEAGDGRHFVGGALTVADIMMFSTLHHVEEVKPGVLAPWPRLAASLPVPPHSNGGRAAAAVERPLQRWRCCSPTLSQTRSRRKRSASKTSTTFSLWMEAGAASFA